MERTLSYFVSDVHLGLQAFDPADREKRFAVFLRGIDRDRTEAVYLMGDIWDFWYEWKYTVPKGYVRIFAAIQELIDAGVKVCFFSGNHDVWTYSYFEELGMIRLTQPYFVEIGGKRFCIGHGDGLGPTKNGYKVMRGVFHSKLAQWMFSSLVHPTVAMWFGNRWSHSNRLKHKTRYEWKGEQEPLMAYARSVLKTTHVDYFIFGHFHVEACEKLGPTSTLHMLDCWLEKDSAIIYDSSSDSMTVI